MQLEILLSLGCIFGSNDACLKSARAYYEYSGIEKNVKTLEKYYEIRSKSVLFTLAMANSISQKRVVAPIFKNAIAGLQFYENPSRSVVFYEYNF